MKKAKITNESFLCGIKRTKDDIYTIYTTEEVLAMDNISEEKKRIIKFFDDYDVIGWVEMEYSTDNDRSFCQVYEERVEYFIED